jgi:hypothetical protein
LKRLTIYFLIAPLARFGGKFRSRGLLFVVPVPPPLNDPAAAAGGLSSRLLPAEAVRPLLEAVDLVQV